MIHMTYTDPCTIALQSDQELMSIHEEPMFLIHGEFHRDNGWVMQDCLSYIKPTVEDAVATCRRLNPNFKIHYVSMA